MPNHRRISVVVRDDRLYLDADAVVTMLRERAAAYVARAEELVAQAADPGTAIEPTDRVDLLRPVDEALACRMVAEELEQRADVLAAIG
jgi:hypothetical protein